jgi:hypothetical protein
MVQEGAVLRALTVAFDVVADLDGEVGLHLEI